MYFQYFSSCLFREKKVLKMFALYRFYYKRIIKSGTENNSKYVIITLVFPSPCHPTIVVFLLVPK